MSCKCAGAWLITLMILATVTTVSAAESAVERLQAGAVLLLRHAVAPGFGDPPEFRIDDCSTQRNLSDEGRQQAAAIGDWLRARGIVEARVYSSQWCRCLDTARLLNLGEVTPLPALNSFFQQRTEKASRLAALREFLATRSTEDLPLILVTHQVTVTALTDVFPNSGEGVVASLSDNGELTGFSRIGFDD